MGARQVYRCSSPGDVDEFLSQGGFTLIVGEEGDIKRLGQKGSAKIQSFEYVIQTLILGCFPDEL
jgi:hypothetical protein